MKKVRYVQKFPAVYKIERMTCTVYLVKINGIGHWELLQTHRIVEGNLLRNRLKLL